KGKLKMLNRQTVALPDALVAMERNLKTMLKLSGRKVSSVDARVDTGKGTASIIHNGDGSAGDPIRATVYFPALPHDYRMALTELDRWTGYFLHEISHALFTEPMAWRNAVQEGLGPLVIGMEDVRIERCLIKSAVADNAQMRLTELLQWAADKAVANDYRPNDLRRLPWTLAYLGRVRINGYLLKGADVVDAQLNGVARRIVDGALVKLREASSTADVLIIARWIKSQL